MPNILILESEPTAYKPLLEAAYPQGKFIYSDDPLDAGHCDILLTRPDYGAKYLSQSSIQSNAPTWIQSTWAGVESLITPLEIRPDIKLFGLKGIFGPLIAEYAFSYMLPHVRKNNYFASLQKKSIWASESEHKILDTLQGKTLAILGLGSIGLHVAKIAKGFNMQVLGFSRNPKVVLNQHVDDCKQDILKVVANADFILACLPNTEDTANIINSAVFEAMKQSAMVINIGRGTTLDLDALCSALTTKKIAAAVIDVFPDEPLPMTSPLWRVNNLVITPHIAAISTIEDVSRIFVDNLNRAERGDALLYEVDVKRGY